MAGNKGGYLMRPSVNSGMAGSSFGGNRRRIICELWSRYLSDASMPQLDKWLARTMREYPSFGKRDRQAYSDVLFSIARYSGTALICEKAFKSTSNSKSLIEIWRSEWPLTESDWITEMRCISPDVLLLWVCILTGSGDEPDCANSGRLDWWKSVLSDNNATIEESLIKAGIPPFLSVEFGNRTVISNWSDEQKSTFLSCLKTRPPVWLRILDMSKISGITREFKDRLFDFRVSGNAIALPGRSNIRSSEAYASGLVEIQDLASQNIVSMSGVKPGEIVWDACAGGGGKTISVAAMMDGRGKIYASDIRSYKLDELKKRADRAHIVNIRIFESDVLAEQKWDIEVLQNNGFDRVIVDAPCSGSGTWRRNPDSRWHINPQSIRKNTELQDRLIDSCSRMVKPGGVLVYSTCSWLPNENETRIENFINRSTGWELTTMATTGSPQEDADTMFAAVIRKKS
jgi:16S rRNA (cytosine967-C5)-methyltransferase